MEFKLGDIVKWRSQAGGHWTEKRGKIVSTLQPHQNPIKTWHKYFINHRRMFDGLRPPNTNGLSYLVSVSDGDDRVPRLYMPRPVVLRPLWYKYDAAISDVPGNCGGKSVPAADPPKKTLLSLRSAAIASGMKLYSEQEVLEEVRRRRSRIEKKTEPSIEDYERLIIQWATERGLLAGTTTEKQMFKLGEEFGEVFGAMLLEDLDKVKLELGDMLVVMVNICGKLGITLKDCIGAAYEKIKDRKGRMVKGSFVKDE